MSARSPQWRTKVALLNSEAASWWARVGGWTLTVSRLRIDGKFYAGLHRFRDGTADMPHCGLPFDSFQQAAQAAEFYAHHGRWPRAGEIIDLMEALKNSLAKESAR